MRAVKRIIDFLGAGVLLVLLWPVMVVVSLVGAVALRGHPFFVQPRPGLNGKIFKLIKFRTMISRTHLDGRLLSDAERLTPWGRFLRSTSLDELPQLINVLRGEMSLVGPRPLLPEYLDVYSPQEMKRHWVRPGITGWAQINGRNATSWDERLRHDSWYVDHWNLRLDFEILARTLVRVLKRDGVSSKDHVTMPSLLEVRGLQAPGSHHG